MPKAHGSPREDSRYHGKPLWLDFDACWQRHTQFTYEWIIPPANLPSLYAGRVPAIYGEGFEPWTTFNSGLCCKNSVNESDRLQYIP